jgi:hypothetical protein
VGEREAQALLGDLADVGSLDVLGLLDLSNSEDLKILVLVSFGGYRSKVEGEYARGST